MVLHERTVHAGVPLDELGVRALLHHAALLNHRDLVGVADGREAVRDHQRRPPTRGEQLVERSLHDGLALVVERRGGLVEHEDGRVAHQGTGDGQPLLLPAGQLHALLAHLRRVLIRKARHEACSVGQRRRRLHLLLRRAVAPHRDVPADRPREQHRLLRYQPDLRAQPAHVEVLHVDAVEQHRAAVGVVEALEQRHHRRLAAARRAGQGHGLPRLDRQVEPLVDGQLEARRVGEVHVAQLDAPRRARRRHLALRRQGVDGAGRCVEGGVDPGGGGARRGERRDAWQHLQQPHEAEEHAEEGRHHVAAGEALRGVGELRLALGRGEAALFVVLHVGGHQRRAVPQPEAEEQEHDRRHRALERGARAPHADALLARGEQVGAEALDDVRLAPVGVERTHASDGLERGGGGGAEGGGGVARRAGVGLVGDGHDEAEHRDARRRDEREPPAEH